MKTLSENRCFGGIQGVYTHASDATGTDMTFGAFLPPKPSGAPVLWYLSGLTCTHENAMTKAGLQAWAAQSGTAIVFPDTSPRGAEVPDDDAYDMGQGAGFYVDATQGSWAQHFQMEHYITADLPETVFAAFDLDATRQAITGHSMGGHGALTLALKYPGRYRSVSAFAPICAPAASDWGTPQLTAYTGDPGAHDATRLLIDGAILPPCLIDTGTSDQFFDKLGTDAWAAALARTRSAATLRLQAGYDHSYFFVASFGADHMAFHQEHFT
ncbi:S-formylglutathione hydrolase [Jannaschia pagri]|uniref:S-formylglutathione hydrolase n=1 Tax=Jannaschia pagri TaxID=2829797 RepID=A0ABQ4NPV1_9RHOB|nr:MULTISPECIES: S-formylglutathione hydrolase [unclassified Jannaschia]GIT92701.1 S-formylglutathione hydrolase [Jannaschia sp. AI_61]GIT96439.1 S-formylglutathione hydrolase [Jannaschia sp. AI_62]